MDRWPRRSDLSGIARARMVAMDVLNSAVVGGHVGVLECFGFGDRLALQAPAGANRLTALRWMETENLVPENSLLMQDYADDDLQLVQLRKRREAERAISAINKHLDPTIRFNENAVADHADARGPIIDWNRDLLRFAAAGGHVSVFRWWKGRFPAIEASDAAIIAKDASMQKGVELLEWFKSSEDFPPLACPLTFACADKRVYEWWRRNDLPLAYDGDEDVRAFVAKHADNRAQGPAGCARSLARTLHGDEEGNCSNGSSGHAKYSVAA
ncbi:hypothetical protein DFJ73DRAFT_917581 [Zopfochytrium polystomum]|nr:hypothetical protein DFJ73DRAFT_917581 [Zopfochytrium polystomum]